MDANTKTGDGGKLKAPNWSQPNKDIKLDADVNAPSANLDVNVEKSDTDVGFRLPSLSWKAEKSGQTRSGKAVDIQASVQEPEIDAKIPEGDLAKPKVKTEHDGSGFKLPSWSWGVKGSKNTDAKAKDVELEVDTPELNLPHPPDHVAEIHAEDPEFRVPNPKDAFLGYGKNYTTTEGSGGIRSRGAS